ncbi:MAG: hypothetical protein NC180_07640 [Muribaculaceae bacterium]|nr:hypothetical protein [Muribaculaceae bacterium]MCM1493078.1 hypothetical protein [Muribaculaceae bacterium]
MKEAQNIEREAGGLVAACEFSGIRPAMAELPYPKLQVCGQNPAYAGLLSIDYCGPVSELSAITQYINNETRLSCGCCPMAKTLLGIAMAEMMHLQKLGQLIVLLGGCPDYVARQQNGNARMWTPEYLKLPAKAEIMLRTDIEAEKSAINQYRMHMRMIRDEHVNAVLARIIIDEEYHIMLLKSMLRDLLK